MSYDKRQMIKLGDKFRPFQWKYKIRIKKVLKPLFSSSKSYWFWGNKILPTIKLGCKVPFSTKMSRYLIEIKVRKDILKYKFSQV